jgi:hypothetical protein
MTDLFSSRTIFGKSSLAPLYLSVGFRNRHEISAAPGCYAGAAAKLGFLERSKAAQH